MEVRGSCGSVSVPVPKSRWLVALLVSMGIVMMLPASPAGAGADPAVKCAVVKQKAATKKLASKMKCHAKAMLKGVGVDPACMSKAESSFETAFEKAEAKGGCATTDDVAAIEALVDQLQADLFDALPRGVCPEACANALNTMLLHGGLHFETGPNCLFSLSVQAGSVSWEGAVIGFPGHGDTIRTSGLVCEVVEEDVTLVAMPLTAAEQASCALLAAEAVEGISAFPCNVSP